MPWKQSIWNFILRRLAKAQGFLDPTTVFAQLQHFSKPSEVWVPMELLRSGAVLQARGLINSQAIQHNLDWIWPFWAERQFNPKDSAFIPRAFSMMHINLTHRNWTAVGIPDCVDMPIVDPRGLVTPLFDGWSIDAWMITENFSIIPSRMPDVHQELIMGPTLAVTTMSKAMGLSLDVHTSVKIDKNVPVCEVCVKAVSPVKAWLAICVRPYNPEGISFVHNIQRLEDGHGWLINGKDDIHLNKKPARYVYSNYATGDIYDRIPAINMFDPTKDKIEKAMTCPVGMASGGALYALGPYQSQEVIAKVPLSKTPSTAAFLPWKKHLEDHCEVNIPDEKLKFLYDAALRTLVLHSPNEVYPGPFTYKRFWFRDAAFIVNAMLAAGLTRNVERIIDHFPSRQTPTGYFMSQDGEWDSNGQALWTMHRFALMTNTKIKEEWAGSVFRAVKWILRKRTSPDDQSAHAGLLPAGFSAEHFGPSDFYYWDDFWAVAGLRAAGGLISHRDPDIAQTFRAKADELMQCVERSLGAVKEHMPYSGIPCSPYRRMDAASIGSLVVSYPLQLWPARDGRILQTVDFLIRKHFLSGCFYHELSHSGINAYMTLHVAQALLRAGEHKFFHIVESLADLASPTGQWPEAIHPGTKGGCMGDGQHVWAAAEWVMMIRNMFVREEEETRTLILCSGIPHKWLKDKGELSLGPTLTVFGKIFISIKVGDEVHVSWEHQWYGPPPAIEIRLPGYAKYVVKGNIKDVVLKPQMRQPLERV